MTDLPGRNRRSSPAGSGDGRGGSARSERTARRAQQRRRSAVAAKRPWWRGPGLVAGIVGVLAIVILAFVLLGHQQTAAPAASAAETAQVVQATTRVPPTTFDAVGAGGLRNPLKPVQSAQLTGPQGHPELLYIGAEYCPYCAAERWSIVAALSRFGSFSGLQLTTSTDRDILPNTPTFTFVNSTYTSSFLDFVAVETETRSRASLQTPTPAQQQLVTQFDPPGSIPFVDVGNRYVGIGSGYSGDVLTGKSWTDIAGSLSNPGSPVARAILGNANYLSAAMCRATGDQPGDVCSSAGVAQAKAQLGS